MSGNGEKALVYLGRYLYRGVIREADLLACDHDGSGQVSFRYRDSQSGQSKVRTLPGAEFLHLLLQHVLPKGFRRARNYGFLHPNKKGLIALLHLVLRIAPRPPTPHKPPAGVCLPLLRQADADPAAATSADGGQPTRFDAGNGDGRVGLRLRHDGAPHQRHGRARPESAEKRPMNAKLRASAGLAALIPASPAH